MDEKTRESNRLRQRKFLELHKDEVNDKRRERYHERISSGKCPRCGSKAKKGRTLCADCCEYMLNLNRKYAERDKPAKSAVTRAKAKPAVKKAVKAKAAPKAASKAKPRTKAAPKAKAKTTAKKSK